MEHPYWKQQTPDKPLFPDLEWSKPEQVSQSGRLGIIGGSKLGFAGAADSYTNAASAGVGAVRILLPDILKRIIPTSMGNVLYGATNPSGSLSQDALTEMKAIGNWSTGILLIGDAGRNSETAIVYENFIQDYDGPLTITRDAIDLLRNSSSLLVERPNTLLVASFSQLQKLFQTVYYPKVLTFSMQLSNLVEILHKFTTTYPICISVLHNDVFIVARDGEVASTPLKTPTDVWSGKTATNAAAYWLWSPAKPLESVVASLVSK